MTTHEADPTGALGPILDRVRKLLALAASPNPNEAAAAARAAQALLDRHRIEHVEPQTPFTDGREAPLEVGRRIRPWKRVLAAAIADANGAAAWVDGQRGRQSLCVVARPTDRAAVTALYDGLVRRIEWCSATTGEGRDRKWHEAFRIGVTDAIVPRLNEADPSSMGWDVDGATAEAGALVRTARRRDRAELQFFLDQHFGPGQGRPLRVQARAYERGRDAGAKLPLEPIGRCV